MWAAGLACSWGGRSPEKGHAWEGLGAPREQSREGCWNSPSFAPGKAVVRGSKRCRTVLPTEGCQHPF